jgi:hypothetical protein
MNMKNNLKYISIFLLAIVLFACDENEPMPSHKTIGTATHTMADIAASNSAPLPSENVSILISYVNPSSDPLKEITVRAKVGAADYVEIQKFNMASEGVDELATKAFSYAAPATSATTVIFDMVITSQKQFPQVQRTTIKTK